MSSRTLSDIKHLIDTADYNNPGTVKSTCLAVRSWLIANPDGYRDFFRECYFTLVTNVFGISCKGYLSFVAGRPAECDALVNFLRPAGTLFQVMLDVDAESLNHYCLPTSHLSPHTQALLCSPAGAPSMPPLCTCEAVGRTAPLHVLTETYLQASMICTRGRSMQLLSNPWCKS